MKEILSSVVEKSVEIYKGYRGPYTFGNRTYGKDETRHEVDSLSTINSTHSCNTSISRYDYFALLNAAHI